MGKQWWGTTNYSKSGKCNGKKMRATWKMEPQKSRLLSTRRTAKPFSLPDEPKEVRITKPKLPQLKKKWLVQATEWSSRSPWVAKERGGLIEYHLWPCCAECLATAPNTTASGVAPVRWKLMKGWCWREWKRKHTYCNCKELKKKEARLLTGTITYKG